jgi:hypothetical protein
MPGFALLSYDIVNAGAVTDADMSALVDANFSQRNNHYIFAEQYSLLAAAGFGATQTRLNMNPPHWNAIGPYNLWPTNRSLTVPSPPQIMWTDKILPKIPLLEEFKVRQTDTAAETAQFYMWIAAQDWTANIPQGPLFNIRATAAPTIVANAWSSLAAITFEQGLRSGSYAVVGATLQGTNVTGFRLAFPHPQMYGSRILRPGALAQNAIGDQQEARMEVNPFVFGQWGQFVAYEPPQVEVSGTTAGTPTCEIRLWLVYLGNDQSSAQLGVYQ